MVDPKKLEQAAGRALGDVNAEVQAKGPGVVGFIKKWWFVGVGALALIIVVHVLVS